MWTDEPCADILTTFLVGLQALEHAEAGRHGFQQWKYLPNPPRLRLLWS